MPAIELSESEPSARTDRWDPRDLLAEHGWTALFLATSLVVARFDSADVTLRNFAGRTVSIATARAHDVGASTGLFASSMALFALAFCAALIGLRALRRASAQHTNDVLEALSIGGCAVWLARAFALPAPAVVRLFSAALATTALAGLLDRWLLRAANAPARGAWLALVGAITLGGSTLLAGQIDASVMPPNSSLLEWSLASVALAVHVLMRLACLRGDPALRQAACLRLIWALAPLGWLALVAVLREELYLTANSWRWHALQPHHVELASLGALALWCVRRWRSAQLAPDALQALGSITFPALLIGLTSFAMYRPTLGAPEDLFEPANPRLFVQQWIDFGRVPFVETFNAHAFSDSLFGFIYAALHGSGDDNWSGYDFLGEVLITFVIYIAMRRLTGNPFVAFFVAALLPFRTEVLPQYCSVALVTALLLAWLVARPNALRWIVFAFHSVALFLWRLDMGAASLLASAATLVAWRLVRTEFRPRVRHIAAAGALCVVVWGGAFFAISLARGVDPLARLEDLRHVLQSNQGFGNVTIAPALTPNVLTNLSVTPLAVLALVAGVLLRLRQRSGPEASFAELFIVWAGAYYFFNAPRGLVRHSWVEAGNVYLLSFALVALSSAVLLRTWSSAHLRAAAFLGAASLLAGAIGVLGPLPEQAEHFHHLWTHWRSNLLFSRRVEPSAEVIDRTPASPQTELNHYAEFRAFIAANLTPTQTFVDLQHAPLLYSDTRRRSPHYFNHLYLAYDEHLQSSEIAEFNRHDIPLAVVWTEDDLAERDGVVASRHNVPSEVFNHIRQWRIHEWLHAGYEPWRIVQRWQIWRRSNWMAPRPPEGERERTLARNSGGFDSARRVRLAPQGAAPFEFDPERTAYVRIRGTAPEQGALVVRVAFGGEAAPLLRTLELPAGPVEHYWTLPVSGERRSAPLIELDFSGAPQFELGEVALLDLEAPSHAQIHARATRWRALRLHWLPWIWGAYDRQQVHLRPALRSIWPPASALESAGAFELSTRDPHGFVNGVSTSEPAIVIDELQPPLAVGERLRFAHSGERLVAEIGEDGRVRLGGDVLDPHGDGRPQRVARMRLSAAARALNRMAFQPLEDPRRSCFLVMEISSPPRAARQVERTGALHWGQGGLSLGRIDFQLRPGLHTYVLPMANHYNFASNAVNWFSFHSESKGVRAVDVKLVAD